MLSRRTCLLVNSRYLLSVVLTTLVDQDTVGNLTNPWFRTSRTCLYLEDLLDEAQTGANSNRFQKASRQPTKRAHEDTPRFNHEDTPRSSHNDTNGFRHDDGVSFDQAQRDYESALHGAVNLLSGCSGDFKEVANRVWARPWEAGACCHGTG